MDALVHTSGTASASFSASAARRWYPWRRWRSASASRRTVLSVIDATLSAPVALPRTRQLVDVGVEEVPADGQVVQARILDGGHAHVAGGHGRAVRRRRVGQASRGRIADGPDIAKAHQRAAGVRGDRRSAAPRDEQRAPRVGSLRRPRCLRADASVHARQTGADRPGRPPPSDNAARRSRRLASRAAAPAAGARVCARWIGRWRPDIRREAWRRVSRLPRRGEGWMRSPSPSSSSRRRRASIRRPRGCTAAGVHRPRPRSAAVIPKADGRRPPARHPRLRDRWRSRPRRSAGPLAAAAESRASSCGCRAERMRAQHGDPPCMVHAGIACARPARTPEQRRPASCRRWRATDSGRSDPGAGVTLWIRSILSKGLCVPDPAHGRIARRNGCPAVSLMQPVDQHRRAAACDSHPFVGDVGDPARRSRRPGNRGGLRSDHRLRMSDASRDRVGGRDDGGGDGAGGDQPGAIHYAAILLRAAVRELP